MWFERRLRVRPSVRPSCVTVAAPDLSAGRAARSSCSDESFDRMTKKKKNQRDCLFFIYYLKKRQSAYKKLVALEVFFRFVDVSLPSFQKDFLKVLIKTW